MLVSENPEAQHGDLGGLGDDAIADLIEYLKSLDGESD